MINLGDTQDKFRGIFGIPANAEVRLWYKETKNSYELLKDTSVSLAASGIYNGLVSC